MEFIEQFVRNLLPEINEETLNYLKSITTHKTLKKGDKIVEENTITNSCFLLSSGIVRSYITNNNGKEHTRTLYIAPSITGSLTSLIKGTPSDATFECLTNCDVIELPYSSLILKSNENIHITLLRAKINEQAFIRSEQKIYDLCVLDGTKRYLKLREEFPTIENLIPQYHIASYLNMTPVQLSRIRRDLFSK